MKTRGNLVTERAGVNFARSVVEGAGSLFKEINLQHDFGHDATIIPVIDGHVRPREIALQVKSGASYVTPGTCHLPASAAHVYFWAKHDLQTLGVVYDPVEVMAYWIDLQTASRDALAQNPKAGTTFVFAKAMWNRFDPDQFGTILLPTLLGEAPTVPLDTVCAWVRSDDVETHDLGVRVIRARHYLAADAWSCLIDAFLEKPAEQLTIAVAIAMAKLLGHDDLGYHTGQVPDAVRAPPLARILAFGPAEIAKLLALLDDEDFERPSLGYSLMPLWGMSAQSIAILTTIVADESFEPDVRSRAASLLAWYRHDPEWWSFWRRDTGKWGL
ncbi:DUF4365 domain-containing protein [Sphingobium sp. 3R8]|uniref:DUF4365 domain-containing protein n=1 Tax=Sphingobium sp. 3R8 TaxID=2874921 RepID=UPI001CCB8D16|nr:DUF4365 domain-containing protein [Sphingobium sp. 3R8]MBZ9647608.1 DUF4365 domain-containing protein [Sphingobium sp. 3R8]